MRLYFYRTVEIYKREVNDAVDKLQAFYKVNPIERVERISKAGSERQAPSEERKNNSQFHKCLLDYYNSKAMEFQSQGAEKTNTYNKSATEIFYEAGNTVNFFG